MEKPRYIVGEVGPKHKPIYERSSTVQDIISNGGLYVGIDKHTENLSRIALDNTAVARGDLAAMHTIPDTYFDEMWIVNVFGEPVREKQSRPDIPGMTFQVQPPRIRLFNEQVLRGEPGTALSCLFQNEDLILEELHRVMRPHGSLYIVELLTPNIAYRLREIDFLKYGFDAQQFVTKDAIVEFFKSKHIAPEEYDKAIGVRRHRIEFAKTNDPFVIMLTKRA